MRLAADSQAAVERFLRRVRASGKLWILDDDDYLASAPSHTRGGAVVYPVFSSVAYARRGAHCWANQFPVEEITLSVFVERLLPAFAEDCDLVGPDWDAHMAGAEVAADEILTQLNH